MMIKKVKTKAIADGFSELSFMGSVQNAWMV
jgi:hypothetical protein